MWRCFLSLLVFPACLPTVDLEPPPVCEAPGFAAVPSVIVRDSVTRIDVPLLAETCVSGEITANIEVFDSENQPVQFEASVVVSGRGVIARVSVLPRRVGPLQVIVVFEPSLGRVVRSTWVVDPSANPDFAPGIESPCEDETITPRGLWLCRLANTVTVWRDAMQLQSLPALRLTSRGDVAWLIGPGQVERFVDRGTDFLVRDPDLPFPITADAESIFVSGGDDSLWVISASSARRWALQNGALAIDLEISLPRGLCMTSPQFDVTGDTLVMTCLSRLEHTRLCVFDPTARCLEFDGDTIGFDDGGVWLSGRDSLRYATIDRTLTTRLPTGFTAIFGGAWFQGTGWPRATNGNGGDLLAVPVGEAIVLQLPPPGLVVLGHGPEGILVRRGIARGLIAR